LVYGKGHSERKPWKTIVVFAMLGLAIAATSYAYEAFQDYTKPMNTFDGTLTVISIVLCPSQLLFVTCIDCEVVGWGGFTMYLIVGVLNAALYSVVGALVVGLRKPKSKLNHRPEPGSDLGCPLEPSPGKSDNRTSPVPVLQVSALIRTYDLPAKSRTCFSTSSPHQSDGVLHST
jgi:hypothetical protein